MAGFQQQVYLGTPLGVAGDLVGTNPRRSVIPASGGNFVSGTGGVVVGNFAWIQVDNRSVRNTAVSGVPDGFIARQGQALITVYLAEAGMTVPQGFGVNLFETGDYLFKANGAAAARGEKVFASLTDGSTTSRPAGTILAGYVETAFKVSAGCLADELAIMSL